MHSWRVAVVAVLVGVSTAHAADRTHVRARLIDAINKRDAKTVESLVALPLRSEKMRFAGEPCRKFWGVAVLVHTTELPAFVNCIASQKVTAVTAGGDAKVDAIYGPGFPLVIAFDADDKVSALTSASEPGSKPLRIEPSTFASHVAKFSREIPPSATTKRALDARGAKTVQAELSLCVDETGATVPVATVADPALKPYEQDVVDAARSWKVEPFKLDGKPQLACATYLVGASAAALDSPVQVSAASTIDSKLLEPLRIRGSKFILPDAPTKTKIAETASKRVIASFKLCLDAKGAPKGITVIKPSGYDAYDKKIMQEMANWAYKPYVVAGSAVPVCSAITFVYSLE